MTVGIIKGPSQSVVDVIHNNVIPIVPLPQHTTLSPIPSSQRTMRTVLPFQNVPHTSIDLIACPSNPIHTSNCLSFDEIPEPRLNCIRSLQGGVIELDAVRSDVHGE